VFGLGCLLGIRHFYDSASARLRTDAYLGSDTVLFILCPNSGELHGCLVSASTPWKNHFDGHTTNTCRSKASPIPIQISCIVARIEAIHALYSLIDPPKLAMPPKRAKKPVPRPPDEDFLEPKPTAKSSTAARTNRARKDSLKVKQNEETARALAASKNQHLNFDLSSNTDAGIELELELESQLLRPPSLSQSLSPLPSQFLT
jgi:hypothetical protein